MNKKAYFLFNCICAGIIISLLFYAGFFAYSTHAVKCVYKQSTGLDCPACGLTRAFHHILTGNFKAAVKLNPVSVQLFLFFAIQLLMRIILMLKVKVMSRKILNTDILISAVLFLVCFFPLLKLLFKS